MYELYPYFTNDGTVGLFSASDDDIYHSTYGALSESWEKFIIPSHLEGYLSANKEVKILDICYGIGYNTKTALQVFLNKIQKKENNLYKNKSPNSFCNLFLKFLHKKSTSTLFNIAAIYTNNISPVKNEINERENLKNEFSEANLSYLSPSSIAAIGSDNIDGEKVGQDRDVLNSNTEQNANNIDYRDDNENGTRYKILIDAVDNDKTLIGLSPFIIEQQKSLFGCPNLKLLNINILKGLNNNAIGKDLKDNSKYEQIINMQKRNNNIKKEFELSKECSIIILKKMLECDSKFFDDENIQSLLREKKYSSFLSRFMLNFAKFYSNLGYKYNKKRNKSTFLHNIYYQYLSRSYKRARKVLLNHEIELNFYANDARKFISSKNGRYNFIFLDAFTPAKCPSLWTVQFFKELFLRLEDDGMILTYSNSAAIRNAFLQNGFYIGKNYDKRLKKFTGTIATKNEKLIEHKLDELDLDLIHSKAGICFNDENLSLNNDIIIKNRDEEVKNSELISSSRIVKGYKNGKNTKSL